MQSFKRGDEKVSAIAEHAWQQHHPIKWEEVRVVDRASRNRELKIKEALHIQMTPDNNKFNRDIGLELPWCWLSMLCANHPLGYNNSMHYPPVILLFTLCLLYYHGEFDLSLPLKRTSARCRNVRITFN